MRYELTDHEWAVIRDAAKQAARRTTGERPSRAQRKTQWRPDLQLLRRIYIDLKTTLHSAALSWRARWRLQ
jgi:hypothetical protein